MNIKIVALGVLAVLPACAPPVSPPDPRLVNSPEARVPTVPDDMPTAEKFQKLYADTTHRVPYYYKEQSTPIMIGGNTVSWADINVPVAAPETRYFAKTGKAWFLLEDEKRVVTGEWRVYGDGNRISMCAAPGYIPKNIDSQFFKKNCNDVLTYTERATHFRAGDPLELQKQK